MQQNRPGFSATSLKSGSFSFNFLIINCMPQYAAVDIGSNSIRLLVADATPEPIPQVTRLIEERQVTRLGEGVFNGGEISEKSIQSVCVLLNRMRQTWQRYEIAGIRAVATSATRDASNQADFVERATEAIGAPVEIISGQEEARLIQLGVQSVWPHPDQRVLIVDVGGGSAELILSENGHLIAGYSRPLGAVRLQSSFLASDPPTPTQIQQLQEYIEEKIAIALPRMEGRKYDRVIATSSSAAAVVCAINSIPRTRRLEADRLKATTPQLRRLFKDLITRTVAQRRKITGIGPRRAEIIIPGAAVLLAVLETFSLRSLSYCSAGVRDGIVADLAIRRVGRERAELSREQRQVVCVLAKRFGVDIRHAKKIADFGQNLFASLEPLHRLPPYFGKLLEAACYLSNVGHFVSGTGHHKHSHYIVTNADLAGFTDQERNFIALLCRYHRKTMPNTRHADYRSLMPEFRRPLLLLLPILRLVDGLHRSQDPRVESVSCQLKNGSVMLTLRSAMDTGLEQWAIERVSAPFNEIYQRTLSVTVEKR